MSNESQSYCYIPSIPFEILSKIFLLYLPDDFCFRTQSSTPSLALLGDIPYLPVIAVCRTWRDTAYRTPQIWSRYVLQSSLDFRSRHSSDVVLKREGVSRLTFRNWIMRAGNSLEIHFGASVDREYSDTLLSKVNQWKSATIDDRFFSTRPAACLNGARRLESLNIYCHGEPRISIRSRLQEVELPNLRSLCFEPGWEVMPHFIVPRLEQLSVSSISPEFLKSVFLEFPRLWKFQLLHFMDFTVGQVASNCEARRDVVLTIWHDHSNKSGHTDKLLQAFPAFHRLHIRSLWAGTRQGIYESFARNRVFQSTDITTTLSSVKSLDLHFFFINKNEEQRFMRLFPALFNLTLRNVDFYCTTRIFYQLARNDNGLLCPNLQHIVLESCEILQGPLLRLSQFRAFDTLPENHPSSWYPIECLVTLSSCTTIVLANPFSMFPSQMIKN